MDQRYLQVLRSIDKFDKIGREGVVELLQKPVEEFGADLDPVRAGLIGQFLDVRGKMNEETLSNMEAFFTHAGKVRRRLDLMVFLEETVGPDGKTKWDQLLEMRPNRDDTWSDGGRPANIAYALDDIAAVVFHEFPKGA